MRRSLPLLVAALAVALAALPGSVNTATTQAKSESSEYVVLYAAGASKASAHAAVAAAGGRIVKENGRIGLATVVSVNPRFLTDVSRASAVAGAAHNRRIGYAVPNRRVDKFAAERLQAARTAASGASRATRALERAAARRVQAEPLAEWQWDMRMIHATATTSHRVQKGDRRVLVGILDTGIDASHPDLAPNFNRRLSRNFTTDIPSVPAPCEDEPGQMCDLPIDGPCAEEPDQSCSDPADVDENSHGTHVAGTVAAAINGLGIAGIAPKVSLVNIRAGQDSGFFFLQPSVDALTYAADHGIDVVNMSYFIDPWLYNCANNPADSPAEQAEQRTIINATQRALRYAHRHGVTLIAAAGNEHTDVAHPVLDVISPDFPPGNERERHVNNKCLDLPSEGAHVLSVTALGPSKQKADYSNYGTEVFVSAPGGWFRDDPWEPDLTEEEGLVRGIPNLTLSTYPENVAREFGEIDEDGDPVSPFVIRDCKGTTCGYYSWFQGTSMASPHAVGVAALIVSEYGKKDRKLGGLKLDPNRTARILKRTATDHACPRPRLFSYENKGRTPDYDARCQGGREYNGFYGHGIVDALRAVTRRGGDHEDDD